MLQDWSECLPCCDHKNKVSLNIYTLSNWEIAVSVLLYWQSKHTLGTGGTARKEREHSARRSGWTRERERAVPGECVWAVLVTPERGVVWHPETHSLTSIYTLPYSSRILFSLLEILFLNQRPPAFTESEPSTVTLTPNTLDTTSSLSPGPFDITSFDCLHVFHSYKQHTTPTREHCQLSDHTVWHIEVCHHLNFYLIISFSV